MDQETVDYVVGKLAKVNATNNLAARISVLYRQKDSGLKNFRDDQILSIRKVARQNKKMIDPDVMEKIEEIADYFEAILVANKL